MKIDNQFLEAVKYYIYKIDTLLCILNYRESAESDIIMIYEGGKNYGANGNCFINDHVFCGVCIFFCGEEEP